MNVKKQKNQDEIVILNPASIGYDEEAVVQLVDKLKKMSKSSCGYLSLTRKSGNCMITAELNVLNGKKITVHISDSPK
jgi:hypothetical protein